jgi:hypothetical protein
MLENNSNVIFLISATGGISGDLSTSYDMRYLEDNLRDESSGQSSFKDMTAEELSLCEEIRYRRQVGRQITAKFFDKDPESYPNIKTREVVERFEKRVLENFIDSFASEGRWLGIYKKQELKHFVWFLFYLFEDDSIQETIAFTQTLHWIKDLVQYCDLGHSNEYKFEKSSEHPNMY